MPTSSIQNYVYNLLDLDATNTGATSIFTADPSNWITLVFKAELTDVADFVTPPSISIGTNSPDYNNMYSDQALNALSTDGTYFLLMGSPLTYNPTHIANNEEVFVKVNTAADATTYKLNIGVVGYYDY